MTAEVDVQRYTDWFVWARANLGRELDATHAAAEAAYRAGAGGGSVDDAQAAARAAGDEPASVDPETMALAEWAAWALGTGRFRADQCMTVATHALAGVQASHDLNATIDGILLVAPPLAGTSPVRKSHTTRNAVIAVVGLVALIVFGLAAAALSSGLSGKGAPPPPGNPATISADVQPSGYAVVYASGLPPATAVYLFVDHQLYRSGETDSDGSIQATIPFPEGGHVITVCFDVQGNDCAASTFATRAK